MDKAGTNYNNPHYPVLPQQMQNSASDAISTIPPPTYDQATIYPNEIIPTPHRMQQPPIGYPPVQGHHQQTNYAPNSPQPFNPSSNANMPQVLFIQNHSTLPLGPRPTYVTCPVCHVQKLTRIINEPSSKTHLMAALLCVFGLWCCACLPYFVNSCMNTNHYCGNCNRFLGTYGNGEL